MINIQHRKIITHDTLCTTRTLPPGCKTDSSNDNCSEFHWVWEVTFFLHHLTLTEYRIWTRVTHFILHGLGITFNNPEQSTTCKHDSQTQEVLCRPAVLFRTNTNAEFVNILRAPHELFSTDVRQWRFQQDHLKFFQRIYYLKLKEKRATKNDSGTHLRQHMHWTISLWAAAR